MNRIRVTIVPHGFMVWHGGFYVGAATELSAAHDVATRYSRSLLYATNRIEEAVRAGYGSS